MPNIVFSSNSYECQFTKEWLVKNGHAQEGSFDELRDGDKLYIIAHDKELGNGDEYIKKYFSGSFPMDNWSCILIVCSAQTYQFGSDLLTPAQKLANHFHRSVYASKTVVEARWDSKGDVGIFGDFAEVQPGTDITTLLSKLQIKE